eukprot:UN11066
MICNEGVSPSIQDVLAGSVCDCSGNVKQEPSGVRETLFHFIMWDYFLRPFNQRAI